MQHNILLVDDDQNILETMSGFLQDEGFHVKAVDNGDDGLALIRQGIVPFSLALIDYHLPGQFGSDVIKQIQKINPSLTVFGFSCDDSDEAYNETLNSGAINFISKNSSDAKILGIVHRACREVEKRIAPVTVTTPSENRKLIGSLGWAGESSATAKVAEDCLKIASTDFNVMIRGPNGTGKELVAKAIHENSSRASKKFVPVNIASLSSDVIESELFGHEKGSFTGANQRKIGFFQAADGGTIFLDEIGELPMYLQPILLRVLQEKTIIPVGSTEPRKIDFRLIVATNAPLEQMIAEKKFREDLFYRLNVLPVRTSSLCERTEDIPHLAKLFFDRTCHSLNKSLTLLQATVEEMKTLSWSGNVRQLENTIIRMVNKAQNTEVDPEILRQSYTETNEMPKTKPVITEIDESKIFHENNEKEIIKNALMKTNGNQSKASLLLNVNRRTLADKIVKYGIKIIKKGEQDE